MAGGKSLTVDDALAEEREVLGPDSGVEGTPGATAGAPNGDAEPLSALCISGGGIRSATFGLGAIQGLAGHGILERFDYLSTVSGGGYIGGWLTAWKNRAGGLGDVIPRLRRDAPAPGPDELDPIQHLRDYNRYLSPQAGGLSTDLWTLLSTVLRNIFLNWLVLIPVVMAVLMVPRLFLSALAFPELLFTDAIFGGDTANYAAPALNAISGAPLVRYGLPILSGILLTCALFFILRYLPDIGSRDPSRFDYACCVLAPLVGAALAFMAFDALYYLGSRYADRSSPWLVVGFALLAAGAAWLLDLLLHPRPLRDRLRVMFGAASLAVVPMAIGTGSAAWMATNLVLFRPDTAVELPWAAYVTLGLPIVLLGFCLGTVLFVGFSSAVLEDRDREWMARGVAEVLLVAFVWLAICATSLVFPEWALHWRAWGHALLAGVAAVTAWMSAGSSPVLAGARAAADSPAARRPPAAVSAAIRVAPLIFLGLLAAALSMLTNVLLRAGHQLARVPLTDERGVSLTWQDHYGILERSHPAIVLLLVLALLLLSRLTSRYVNVNTFSLHGMYRDRLIRAYLGASNAKRTVSRFTGFASNDDVPLAEVDPRLKPFHVVNLTLNLVATSRLAWQQRKAESFTATALHCGNASLGYRPTSAYGGGMTLGTAVALSGAAASPNMGYHSSPIVGFIMTLFNARLGAWLGNPGAPGEQTWTLPGPQSAVHGLVKEALGQTTDRSRFVYLSDGGHFENLALYEMVRRRCRLIVVLDSGCDPGFTFDDLGNALRKIRIDFGIPIAFEDGHIRMLQEHKRRCALATIGYSTVDGLSADGRLIYVKPVLLGTEPPDVQSYAAAHPAFPHQSTAEQWFDESQTESYRQLGLLTIDEMCRGWKGNSLTDLYEHLERVYLKGGDTTVGRPASVGG